MPRRPEVYLEDMLAAAQKVEQYVAGLTREQLAADSKTLDAVVRNLEVIGEAAGRPSHRPGLPRPRPTITIRVRS
ncbi:MAG TPA: HepT-like ribonuclease domain-containing protein [Phycisphaerae bacterium]|nr:HepT-like ribonuclease domain-containing protein [Phycisphaerae bacterium]HUU91006.1 HepT-like ribonuclease domain-containing protein [Phycisphaerae bacterium]